LKFGSVGGVESVCRRGTIAGMADKELIEAGE
jgi:hypothetical protein